TSSAVASAPVSLMMSPAPNGRLPTQFGSRGVWIWKSHFLQNAWLIARFTPLKPNIDPKNFTAKPVQLLEALAVSELLAQLPTPDRKRTIRIADIGIRRDDSRRLAGNHTGGGGHGAVVVGGG